MSGFGIGAEEVWGKGGTNVDDGFADGGDGVDDGHDAGADGGEDALDLYRVVSCQSQAVARWCGGGGGG